MRSLVGLSHWGSPISGSQPRSRVFIANDYENQVLFTAFEDDRQNVRVFACDVSSEGDKTFLELCRIPIDAHDGKTSPIVNMTYIAELRTLCMALRNGDITLISKERFDNGQEALEIVGTVDTGIAAMSWSPDQDLIVLITGAKNVLEMTLEFETITEFPLHVEELGEGVQHSVGWGKKETQFHGSAGKQAALNKVDTSKFTKSEDDDGCPRIAWRGDGSYFVCSDVDPRKDARVARIYNREGVLQNTSEPVDRLEHVLDWRPSGNLIVSSQRLPHRHDIVFFERNGLRHGEFTLRGNKEHKVLEVSWNSDSTVLAIWLEIKVSADKYKKSVQLWTMNNYHWYLKQHIVFPGEMDICGFHWDSESPLCAHIADSNGAYHRFIYTRDVIASTSTDESNPGYVAVIDGSSILLTPFSYQNVPPPMSALTLSVEDNVQMIAFGPTKSSRKIAAVTNQSISFHELPEDGRGQVQKLCESPLPKTIIRQLQWVEENTVAFAQFDTELGEDLIVFANICLDTGALETVATKAITGGIGRLYHNVNTKDTIIEDNAGKVYKAELTPDGQVCLEERIQLPTFCTWIATARVGRSVDTVEDVIIALTERGKLYGNDRLLSSECTSFFLRSDWLVYTTTSHTARFLPLDIDFENFKLDDTAPDANDESYRRVERGSKIVLATHSKPSLILQMPRGNLETINPRAFVLASIRENLKCSNYRTAFLACRRNRIDLNILFDEDPEKFFENVPKFIEQIPEVDHLNLFLSNLRDDDSTLKIYHHAARPAIQHNDEIMTKVNRICRAFREVLMERGRDQYMQSILSTYVKSKPPELESALSLLSEIRETDINAAEEALRYTIFLCDAEKLYNVALGMYNFPLVLMVAQQAQKDPREYLPFLQGLQKLEKFYQRYKIDDHLKRYEKALRNLSRAGDDHFDELLQYMQQHSLYLVALEEYNTRPDKKKIILNLYGEYLVETNAHAEAGIVFKLAKEPGKALNAYKLADAWREVFALAGEMQLTEQEIQDLAYTMIEQLKDKRRYQDAATVACEYAKDVEEAIECLLKGSHWQEAVRLSYSRNRRDLIETHVKPGIVEGFNIMNDDIDDMINQFNKQTARLKELREKKPEIGPDLPPDESLDNIDMFSDTTSMYSQFTRYTQATSRISTVSSVSSTGSRKTSKLRRKEQRKRERGKKGTIFEEEYLVNSLKRLYERASNLQVDVHELLSAMVPFEYVDEAKAIQTKFGEFLESLGSAVDTIFVPLRIAAGRFASPEEYEAFKEPVVIEKPKMADHKWKLAILS